MKNINYQQKEREIISWLKSTVSEAGFGRVIVAVSGGVDSAVSLNLAVRALGASNVYTILMPYGKLSTKALSDGKIVARSSGLEKDHIFVKDIKKAADKILKIT
ncbi:MAG TPA: 7-cyano-7-deazaguanine synthase, partial [Patescibacteria group bacterium]